MLTAVHVLLRVDDEDPPVFVRAFRSYEAALAACESAHRYLEAPERPQRPHGAPEGFMVNTVVPDRGVPVTLYRTGTDDWMSEADARLAYPILWALYDARLAAYHWWQRANPIDPEAPEGSIYTVVVVEYEDA